jgi:hypothetical protein
MEQLVVNPLLCVLLVGRNMKDIDKEAKALLLGEKSDSHLDKCPYCGYAANIAYGSGKYTIDDPFAKKKIFKRKKQKATEALDFYQCVSCGSKYNVVS